MSSVTFGLIYDALKDSADSYHIQTDRLKKLGLEKGTEVRFIVFNRIFRPAVYLLWLKDTKRYIVTYLSSHHLFKSLRIGKEIFSWSKIEIMGELRRKPDILCAEFIE